MTGAKRKRVFSQIFPVRPPGFAEAHQRSKIDRSGCMAVASYNCVACRGTGIVHGDRKGTRPCNCVYRNVFRICYRRWREAGEQCDFAAVKLLRNPSSSRPFWSNPVAEYRADFVLSAERALAERPVELKIFRILVIEGLPVTQAIERCSVDRGAFFHNAYRMETLVGREFWGTVPYSVWPPGEYFAGLPAERSGK